MKYLKSYENNDTILIYKIGDFLKIESDNQRLNPYHIVYIVDNDSISYTVEYINQNINKIRWINIKIYSDTIKRLATPEEIESYMKLKNIIEKSEKYNL